MAKFFIDAGHGGSEIGAVGSSFLEKNINLTVALETKRILEINGQQVQMARLTDSYVSLSDRCTLAHQYGADYFISIHHNACNGSCEGGEVYHSVLGGKGKILAEYIAKEFAIMDQTTKVLSRQSETSPGKDYYAVIRETRMPAIITEFGYMDNPKDFIQFDEYGEQVKEAEAIATGCLKMLGVAQIRLKSMNSNPHWAQSSYDYLISRGIIIHEARFDDKVTRGEIFSLLAQLVQ